MSLTLFQDEPHHEKTCFFLHIRKQIKLISAFDIASQIMQPLYLLNPRDASSHFTVTAQPGFLRTRPEPVYQNICFHFLAKSKTNYNVYYIYVFVQILPNQIKLATASHKLRNQNALYEISIQNKGHNLTHFY